MYWEEYSSNRGHGAPENKWYKILINELHWNLHFAICPYCGSCVNYGMIRLPNLKKRHQGTKVCKTVQRKWDKNEKKKDGTILSFLRPKAAIIPSTVNGPPPVHSYKLVPQSASNASPAAASITAEQGKAISNLMFVLLSRDLFPTASSRCYNIWSKTYQWVSLKCMYLRGWPCLEKSRRNWACRRGLGEDVLMQMMSYYYI